MSFSCLNIVVSCSMMIQIISLVTKIFVIMFNLYIEPDKMSEICYSIALSELSSSAHVRLMSISNKSA